MSELKITRRGFLRWLGLMAGGLGATGFGGWKYIWDVEPWWLSVERARVPIDNLPPPLEGFSIAQLSDFHWGRDLKEGHIAQAVNMALEARPDIVVLTGDYVTHSAATSAIAPPSWPA